MVQPKSWDWTPSPFMNRMMSFWLRTPGLHRMLSGSMCLLTFTGRKSGKRYTTPVGYTRDGDCLTVMTKRFRSWWHNFETPVPVQVQMGQKTFQGEAQAITDDTTITPIFAHILTQDPRQASFYGLTVSADGKPNIDQIREIAPKLVIIQVTLDQD